MLAKSSTLSKFKLLILFVTLFTSISVYGYSSDEKQTVSIPQNKESDCHNLEVSYLEGSIDNGILTENLTRNYVEQKTSKKQQQLKVIILSEGIHLSVGSDAFNHSSFGVRTVTLQKLNLYILYETFII